MKNNDANQTKSSSMFDFISGIYSLFYKRQQDSFRHAINTAKAVFDISLFDKALDVGCGTGALCSLLSGAGLKMTGLDNSNKMLDIAKKKNASYDIDFIYHNALKSLPFDDSSFDFSIASYVSHGLIPKERMILLKEMKRVSNGYVILHEFSKKRRLATNIIEYLEGGNYFYFIKHIEDELAELFHDIKIIKINKTSFWYVCKV